MIDTFGASPEAKDSRLNVQNAIKTRLVSFFKIYDFV